MPRKALVMFMIGLLTRAAYADLPLSNGERRTSPRSFTAADFGVGSYVDLRLKGGQKVRGVIEAVDSIFCVVNDTGDRVPVPYSDIKKGKVRNYAFGKAQKFAIIFAIGGVLLILAALELRKT